MKRFFKLVACILLMFAVLLSVGCKGLVKSTVKEKVGKEVARQATTEAVGQMVSGNDKSKSNNSGSKTAGAVAAGVVAAGAATAVGGNENTPFLYIGKGSNELSFGLISIGMSQTAMITILIPTNVKRDGSFTRYQVDDMEAVTQNDTVVALVSNSSKVMTKREIRQGDSLQKVLQAYGTPNFESDYNGSKLYEYKFVSSNNRNCLLRFAIKNQKVEYISMRVID